MKKFLIIFFLIPVVTLISYGQNDEKWFTLGKISFSQNDLQQSLFNFSHYIEDYPQDPIGYIYRAKIYKALGRNDESDLDLEIAERLNPLSLMIVNPSLRSQSLSKNLYSYSNVDSTEPFNKSLSNYDSYKNKIEELDLFHAQDSLITSSLNHLIKYEVNKAELVLNQVNINNNNKAIVYDIYGKIYMKKGDYRKALEYFNKSIEADKGFAIAYHNRSVCYKNMGNIASAKKDLDTAISLNDNVAVFYFSKAKLNQSLGNKKKAKANYEQALELDNDYTAALTNYAQLLKNLGEYGEGVKYLNQAIDSDTDESLFLEANIDFIYGEYEKAIVGFENYLDIHADDSSALFNLGLSKILLRRTDEGCSHIEESLLYKEKEKHQNLYNLFCN